MIGAAGYLKQPHASPVERLVVVAACPETIMATTTIQALLSKGPSSKGLDSAKA